MRSVYSDINTGGTPVFISLTPAIDFVNQYIEAGNRDEDAYILVSSFVASLMCADDTADRDYRALLKILVTREDAISITMALSRIIHGAVRAALPNWLSIDPHQKFQFDQIKISDNYLCITLPTYPTLAGVYHDSNSGHNADIAEQNLQTTLVVGPH